jgi:hypothetical protein
MKTTAILESHDMFVLFESCPTCNWHDAGYLVGCRVYAQKMGRRLRIVPSGSPTARAIRTIAKGQGVGVRYPMILLDGLIYFTPKDINLADYVADDETEEKDDTNED